MINPMAMRSLSLKKEDVNLLMDHWIWRIILLPFVLVRSSEILVIYLAQRFLPLGKVNPVPWNFSLTRFILTWSNWDSAWYISIIKEGYHLNGPILKSQSNIAFYPLYPYIVKILSWPIYHFFTKDIVLIGIGIIISNAFLIGALVLLYKFIVICFDDLKLAERSIVYIIIFPAAFFFSCFYTESTFLFFAIASFYYAKKTKWPLSGLMAALAGLSRPLGVLIAIPLALIYLESNDWQIWKTRLDFLWFFLAPVALLLYMASLVPVTGDLFAIFQIQAAWHKVIANPLATLLSQPWKEYSRGIFEIDRISLILFTVLALISLRKRSSLFFGLFPLLMLGPVYFSGQLASVTRYCSVLFPGFILLAMVGKNAVVHKTILTVFFTLHIIFFIAWCQGYWVQ
jgi:hypothetical protein